MSGRRAFAVVAAVLMMPSLGLGQGKAIKASLSPAGARALAPGFELTDTSGRTIRLSDFHGQILLLDFWATKCGGCVEEIPTFVEIATAYRSRGLAALGVSEDIIYENLTGADQAWSQVRPFVRDHQIGYPVVVDDRAVHRRYDITALPLTYLLDRQGRIAATYRGVVDRSNLEENIEALLRETRP